jgi:hypothetical protein
MSHPRLPVYNEKRIVLNYLRKTRDEMEISVKNLRKELEQLETKALRIEALALRNDLNERQSAESLKAKEGQVAPPKERKLRAEVGCNPIPMVLRSTGRTIPDLTKREHVCEYQAPLTVQAQEVPTVTDVLAHRGVHIRIDKE